VYICSLQKSRLLQGGSFIVVELLDQSKTKPLNSEPAGRVPPDAILFVQAATKRMQKMPFSLRRATSLPDFIDFYYLQ